MAEPARSRRSTLHTLILSLLGGAGLWRFLTPRLAPSRPVVSVPAADVPAGGALVLPEERVAIVREGSQVMALDLTCPHLACTVRATAEGFACPCHGSRFGPRGEVHNGPAPRDLARLDVAEHGGVLHVTRT